MKTICGAVPASWPMQDLVRRGRQGCNRRRSTTTPAATALCVPRRTGKLACSTVALAGWDGEGSACILHIVQPGGTSPLREPRALNGGAAGVVFNQPGNAPLQPS